MLDIYVISVDPDSAIHLETKDGNLIPTLQPNDEGVSVQLQDLLTSVTEKLESSLSSESELTIEITGALSVKGAGKAKYLFFNVEAEASKSNTMKVVLKTTLKPQSK
jgi:hypothetical protein